MTAPDEGLDLSPAPVPAPPAKRIFRHGLIETRLLIRNGEQLLLALVIPVAILVASRFVKASLGSMELLGPSVLALAVWSSAFTSTAISTAFERRYGVLERLATTPLGKPGLLAGKALAVIMIMTGQLVILAGAALAFGWRPRFTPLSALFAVLLVILATATFVCLALLLAGRLRAESVLGLANLIYVILLIGGALIIPVARYPAALRPLIEALPTAALGEGLRAAANGQVLSWPVLVLLAWLVAAGLAAWKGFRWTS
ncbi:MAG TPA: ABC transporter permease [Propionibacteriaceae bacterium]|jgi:ABC-2 type transport system permease protein|nr:ABC transporter permease [Propionibacteriaceae bacterium]